jgi:hypothetical protein
MSMRCVRVRVGCPPVLFDPLAGFLADHDLGHDLTLCQSRVSGQGNVRRSTAFGWVRIDTCVHLCTPPDVKEAL